MKFVMWNTDSKRVRLHSAKPVGSIVYPVTDEKYFFEDPDSAIELIRPRLLGWFSSILPPRRDWILPLASDDAYPLDFGEDHYRRERSDLDVAEDEAKAHEVTYDVAMTSVQMMAVKNFFTKPLAFLMIVAGVAFLLMVLTWIITGLM